MAYRDRLNLEPLQITAVLRTAVISDQWLPLDGILLYQAHRELSGPQAITLPGEYSAKGVSTLPLAIEHPSRKIWYYRASWAEWSANTEGKDFWNKRFDNTLAELIDFGAKRGKVIVSEGAMKAYHQPVFYRSALWVRWYCVGDKSEITRLLSTCTHLGKKYSQGWGRVARWEIESIADDFSTWKDGKLMRGIPEADRPADHIGNVALYGIRPSYWKSENQMMLVMP